ncbi:MAG: glutathione S-transferase family protein [Rhodobacteraceae bacterium]|nr:glutathione S-transferase family protein [Paracoccaceae bacterium]
MYTLVGFPQTRAFRVLWALEEIGLEYEYDPARPRSEAATRLNPSGKVPVLIDGGVPVIDSVAIIQYLADKHQKMTFAAGTIERAQQDSLTQFVIDELDAALWCAARNSFILPEDKRVPEIKDTLKWEFSRSISVLEERLGDKEFLMGDTFTVPDIILTHCGGWARAAGFDVGGGSIRDYFRRMVKRPAYVRADAKRSA